MRFGKRASLLILLIVGAVAVTGCVGGGFGPQAGWSGPVLAGDLLYVGSQDGQILALDPQDRGRVEWEFPQGEEPDIQAVYGTPVVEGGKVFFGGWDGRVYALDALTGKELWSGVLTKDGTPNERDPGIVGGPAVEDDTLFIGASDWYLYALDIQNGSERWRFKTGEKVWSTPTVANGVVYISSLDHRLYAIDARACNAAPDRCQEKWQFEAVGGIVASPLVLGNRVYVGAFDRNFYALDIANGQEIYRYTAGNWFWSGAVTDGTLIYAPSLDGKLYALDKDLQLRWSFDTGEPILVPPALVAGQVVVASDAETLYVLDAQSGDVRWSRTMGDKIRAPVFSHGEKVYLHVMNHTVREVDIAQERQVWSANTKR